MKIATIEEVNLLNCCSCELPLCDTPKKECQSISGNGYLMYVFYDSVTNKFYRTFRYDYADGGFQEYNAPKNYWATLGGVDIEPFHVDFTQGEPQTGDVTATFSNPVDINASRSASFAAMVAAVDWETMDDYGSCVSFRKEYTPVDGYGDIIILVMFVRYRFGIPTGYTRSTWEMQWDEGFFPKAWLDWDSGGRIGPEPTRPSLLASRSWNYSGGDGISEWFYPAVPADVGETRIVNVMVKCWKSTRLGVKPTISGEVFVFDS